MNQPLVSVLLPVYNSGEYVYQALKSILEQTYHNLEILVIINGTSDNSYSEIEKLSNDSRIKIIDIPEKIGLIKTLNIGISESSGQYIARMDADDIAFPTRIEKQINFLENNKEYGLCATWYKTFDGTNLLGKNKTEDYEIKLRLLHQCHICHPSVIIRKSILTKYNLCYSVDFPHSEDYALWIEMSDKTKFHTYPEVLLKYRDHEKNISKLESKTQQERSIAVKQYYFKKIGVLISEEDVTTFTKLAYSDFTLSADEMYKMNALFLNIHRNMNEKIILRKHFLQYIKSLWNAQIINNKNLKLKDHSSSLIKKKANSTIENLILTIKKLMKS